MAANGLGLLALALLGRLLEVPPQTHLTENTLPLQLLLERAKGLIDIVVTNVNLHGGPNLLLLFAGQE